MGKDYYWNGTIDGGTLAVAEGEVFIDNNLIVEGGAQVTARQTLVIRDSPRGGTLTITGSLTTWHDLNVTEANGQTLYSGGITVAGLETELLVENGATLAEDETLEIDDFGAVTVSGGAILSVGSEGFGGLFVAADGSGSLAVIQGGTFESSDFGDFIGPGFGSTGEGTVTVDGSGSTWNSAGQLVIGTGDTGIFTASNSASVKAGDISVGVLGGSGTLTIASGAVVEATGQIAVGDSAVGQLFITTAGTVTAGSLVIGNQASSHGFVNLADSGSLLNVSGALTIGAQVIATLDIGSGATVEAGSIGIGTHGIVNDLGGVLDSPATLTNSNIIQGFGTIAADIDNEGTIIAFDGTETITGSITGTGTLDIGRQGNLVLESFVGSGQIADFTTNNGTLTLADPQDFHATIKDFGTGDVIVVFGATGASLANNILTVLDGTATLGSFTLINATATPVFGENLVPCFLEGTHIATSGGDVAVEHLLIGDLVRTHSGALRPIRWIGTRAYTAGRLPANARDIVPIRVAPGALGNNMPRQELFLSPLHAVYLYGVLVPIGELVNGVTIRACPEIAEIVYYHVELDTHDVILAEGAPCESFLDTGNRVMFANCPAGEVYGSRSAELAWASDACAPLVDHGARLEEIRAAVNARAGITYQACSRFAYEGMGIPWRAWAA